MNKTAITFVITCITAIVFSLIMLYRNEMIYDFRTDATDIYYDQKDRIGVFDDYGSYDEMLYSLTMWDFEDFYPNLNKDGLAEKQARKKRLIRGEEI